MLSSPEPYGDELSEQTDEVSVEVYGHELIQEFVKIIAIETIGIDFQIMNMNGRIVTLTNASESIVKRP